MFWEVSLSGVDNGGSPTDFSIGDPFQAAIGKTENQPQMRNSGAANLKADYLP